MTDSWIQLDGVEQILPFDAWELEILRRKLLDRLFHNGYDLVVPPIADFVESLLGGTNEDLDLLTVKAPDYASGKLFGIRADMTPQIARVAAHHMPVKSEVVRLCYFGPTLLARSRNKGGSRELLQYGAELFGSSAPQADGEVVRLMVECLQIAGAGCLSVSLGHVGIIGELFNVLGIDANGDRHDIIAALEKKSKPRLAELNVESKLSNQALSILSDVVDLNGDVNTVNEANSRLIGISERLDPLLLEFKAFIEQIDEEIGSVKIHVDYAQVGGYQYHTGIIFSAYGSGYGHALANGGRYDNVLTTYGVPCPATGFSGDLRLLRQVIRGAQKKGILLSEGSDVPTDVINAQFANGDRVIRQLPRQSTSSLASVCDRKFIENEGRWIIVPLQQE